MSEGWGHFVLDGLVHRGEASLKGVTWASGWPWFACGRGSMAGVPTNADVTCMHCAAGIPFKDWRERDP